MRRARNQKTRKSAAKRFKISATGRVFRNRPGKRHLLSSKRPNRRRRLGTSIEVSKTDLDRVLRCLPFSR